MPYVGVSGVVSKEQQNTLRKTWDELGFSERRLAFGVKAVRKTQWLDVENKYGPEWYPVGEGIADALAGDRNDEMRVAQVYLDEVESINAGEGDYDKRFIDKLMGRAGATLTAIQFDLLPWDTSGKSDLFRHIKNNYPDTEILLQAHGRQMQQHGHKELVRRLNWYDGLIDRVLFDASHGTGKRLDVDYLLPFVQEAEDRTDLGIGIAGGLNSAVLREELVTILKWYPDLSFDAEGQLHGNADSTSNALNMPVTVDYLRTAHEITAKLSGRS